MAGKRRDGCAVLPSQARGVAWPDSMAFALTQLCMSFEGTSLFIHAALQLCHDAMQYYIHVVGYRPMVYGVWYVIQ